MINYDRIQSKINNTRFLIESDSLIIPSELEDEIANIVISYLIRNDNYKMPTLKKSTFEIEIAKIPLEIQKHFESEELIKEYKQLVLDRDIICQCALPQEYFTSFRGPQIPWELNIPYQLDELSHVYIGHEIMHILANSENYDEWKYLLLYSDVIPMLYELLQGSKKDDGTREKIIEWRFAKLAEMHNNAFNSEITHELRNDQLSLKYYQMPEKQYFISFYYTVLLYLLYHQDANLIITEVKNVLSQKNTTKKMLENLGMLNDIDKQSFEKGYNLILRK